MEVSFLFLIPLAFICELFDSALGMGYGTTLTPLLLLLGYEPLQVVPAILLSEFVTGFMAANFHHSLDNVNFTMKSEDTKVAAVLGALTIVGVVIAAVVALSISKVILELWIGIIIILMGGVMIWERNYIPKFSWYKISSLGILASFNKGLSGGGYGPLVMGGQTLSGIGVKNAVGITSLAESVTCLVALICYGILRPELLVEMHSLALWLMVGAVLSVPFAARLVKWMPEKDLRLFVAVVITALGALVLLRVVF